MTIRQHGRTSHETRERANRRGDTPLRFGRCRLLVLLLLAALGGGVLSVPARAQTAGAVPTPARVLTLAEIQLEGATRTPLATVYRYLPLRPGQPIDQAALIDGVAALRDGGLFKSVAFYTRPGAQRGQLILVLEVVEHDLDFRWAAGNTNLDGWYLSPAMLAYDNPFGRGGRSDLQWRLGFRTSGLLLSYARPRAGDGSSYWGTQLSLMSTDRPWFADGVEYRHTVGSIGWAGVAGWRVGARGLIETGLELGIVDASDHATAFTNSADGTITFDQQVSGADLPPEIRAATGQDQRAILHVDWQHDTRAERRRAGTPVSGAWGRLKAHTVLQDNRSHLGLQGDLRLFREVPGGVLAARLRGAWVGRPAAFYDRLYLGGMYTVRGFPTHALSTPGGDTWLVSGSVEYRTTILRDARGAKLAGLFFVDAGAGGASDAPDPYPGVAAAAGYGVRARVWWVDWVGVDVGFPLTERPLDMRFQVTASLGWSF